MFVFKKIVDVRALKKFLGCNLLASHTVILLSFGVHRDIPLIESQNDYHFENISHKELQLCFINVPII